MADELPSWAIPLDESPTGAPGRVQGLPPWAVPLDDPPAPKPSAEENLAAGQLVKPEDAAKALKLGPQTGTPPSGVALNPERHQEDVDRRDAIAAVQNNPNIRNYVAKDPLHASVSQGDFPALDQASQSMSQLEPERMQNASFGRMLLEVAKVVPAGRAFGDLSQAARLFSQNVLGAGKGLMGFASVMERYPKLLEAAERETFGAAPTPQVPGPSLLYRIGQAGPELAAKIPTTE